MPKPGGRWYSYAEQARHYRQAARDRGCTCPDLPPHVHLMDCPLYDVPGGVPAGLHRHTPAAAAVPSPGGGAIEPVSSTNGSRESVPGDAGKDSPSPGAGDLDYVAFLEHLEAEHDADDGRPWL